MAGVAGRNCIRHPENVLPCIEPGFPLIEIVEQGVGSTMTKMRKLEEQVAAWPHVSVHPHRFGGREFRLGNAELGHPHIWGAVGISVPRGVGESALAGRLCGVARWVPTSWSPT